MCEINGEAYFSHKYVYKWSKHRFAINPARLEKTLHEVEIHWLSDKEKVLGAVVSKEGHADSLLGRVRIHYNWFPWRRCNYKQCFLFPTPEAKLTLFIE